MRVGVEVCVGETVAEAVGFTVTKAVGTITVIVEFDSGLSEGDIAGTYFISLQAARNRHNNSMMKGVLYIRLINNPPFAIIFLCAVLKI